MVKELSYKELQELVKEGKPVLADFWAEWCGPCKQLAPVFEEVAEKLKDCTFVKVNVEQNPDAAELGISSIPCMILFKDGKEADRLVGAFPADQLEEKIRAIL